MGEIRVCRVREGGRQEGCQVDWDGGTQEKGAGLGGGRRSEGRAQRVPGEKAQGARYRWAFRMGPERMQAPLHGQTTVLHTLFKVYLDLFAWK